MNKNTFLNLKIRVCGEEAISLVNSDALTFLLGFERGDPSSIADATRYF